jgi:glucuronate isomerase
MALIHDDRLFPADPTMRNIARRLYAEVRDLPLICPHGHTQASWFANDEAFPDPAKLFVQPDHYIFRMLYSQGITMEELEIGAGEMKDPRRVWRIFAENYYLFRGTPTRMWLDYSFHELFGLDERLSGATADLYYDVIAERLKTPEFRPRVLYERFRIEVLATTDTPLDSLAAHQAIRDSGWKARGVDPRIVPAFRPDSVVDPEFAGFAENLAKLGQMTGEDTGTWKGYLHALEKSRARFKALGCTSTDHGHPTALTADLPVAEASALYDAVRLGRADARLHPGSFRDHNRKVYERYGRDVGADIPVATDYVHALHPLLSRFGNEKNFTLILFTLDETTYTRELAPLAGHYPCLRLGPPWWFHDSPEGMLRFREQVTETAGFYNTVGFNDDTRAFLSIPARHDVARRIDCVWLARLVAEHRLDEDEAVDVAHDLAYNLVRKAYKL